MKISSLVPLTPRRFALLGALACAAWIQSAPVAQAQDPDPTPTVGYTPSIVQIQDMLPFSRSYTFQLTAPLTLPLGVSTPVVFAVTPNGKPAGVTDAVAVSYITVSPTPVVFTGPNQIQTVTVTMQLPANAVEGAYGYKIIAVGFPADPLLGLENVGTFINATVTAAALPPTPPQVSISTPEDGSTLMVNYGDLPVSIPFSFTATGPGPVPSPIDSITYGLDGDPNPITLTSLTGLNTLAVSGTGSLLVSSAGTHSVNVSAHNSAGTASTANVFTVTVNAPPPTVKIDTPADGATFTYYAGSPALSIPFQFTGQSTASVIRSLSAKLDGQDITFATSNLNTPMAVGTTNLSLLAGGTHVLSVVARDDYGTATDVSNFVINVITPRPTIAIDDPDQGQTFSHTAGTPALNIPFTFYTNTNAGFNISAVSATLDGAPLAIDLTVGLGTTSATSTGTMLAVPAGTHTIAAFGVCSGITVTTSVTFSVVEVAPVVPPSVVINTPAPGTTYTLSGTSVSVPLNFTGKSNMPGGVITGMTATLDGNPVTISWPPGQQTPIATATVPVTTTGTHIFKVTASDAVGTADDSQTFTVIAAAQKTLSGIVFFDINVNGVQDAGEPTLGTVAVKLMDRYDQTLATTTTAADGSYSFTVAAGTYGVEPIAPAGLSLTTVGVVGQLFTITTQSRVLPKTGFGLNFCAIRTMRSSALSQGFWKNNVSKNLCSRPSGTQISLADMKRYTAFIATLALPPFDGLTMNTASSIFSGKNQLQLQLLAAEYNYARGAYIGGNQILTYAFIYWGEAVLQNKGSYYSSAYQSFAASWFEAYNTSEGGAVLGPLPSGSNCSTAPSEWGGSGSNCDRSKSWDDRDSRDCDKDDRSDRDSKDCDKDYRSDRDSKDSDKDYRSDRDSKDCDKDCRSDRDSKDSDKGYRSDRDSKDSDKDYRSDRDSKNCDNGYRSDRDDDSHRSGKSESDGRSYKYDGRGCDGRR